MLSLGEIIGWFHNSEGHFLFRVTQTRVFPHTDVLLYMTPTEEQ